MPLNKHHTRIGAAGPVPLPSPQSLFNIEASNRHPYPLMRGDCLWEVEKCSVGEEKIPRPLFGVRLKEVSVSEGSNVLITSKTKKPLLVVVVVVETLLSMSSAT